MLKQIMLRKKIDEKKKALEELRAKDADFKKREAELEESIGEASTDEEQAAVEEAVTAFETEKKEHDEAKENLEKEVGDLEEELRNIEEEDEKKERAAKEQFEKREEKKMPVVREVTRDASTMKLKIRDRFNALNIQERDAIFADDGVKAWIGEIRAHISEKRELTNVGLTIPEVFIGYLRENVMNYSKLYRHVNRQAVSGTGREVIMGSVPEGIWIECCQILNEMSLNFNDVEVDCFKVGGYFKVCNAVLEDSDLNLSALILEALSQSIGLALDKAILYGRNTADHQKMPLGVMSRLVQTEQPSGYPASARPWANLSATNIISIPATTTGLELFKQITLASGKAKGRYARGEKVWVMNEETYTKLKVEAMGVNAAGAIVSALDGRMPVVGGIVETLDFIPNDVIIGGYFELYLLGERAGNKFAQSEHAFFIQDQTAFKGTARYDGQPVIPEAFVAIGINGVTPDAAMDFAPDNANSVQNIILNYAAATVVVDETLQLKATTLPVEGNVTWASSDATKATVDGTGKVTGIAAGKAVITATSGNANATANITVSAGA